MRIKNVFKYIRRKKKVVVWTLSPIFIFSLVIGCFLFSPDPISEKTRRTATPFVNRYFQNMAVRSVNGEITFVDKVILYPLYYGMMVVGRPFYPEASTVLYYYMRGNGEDLRLPADYYRNSPSVRKVIDERGEGHHQDMSAPREDTRLYYALNPFSVKVEGRKRVVYDIVDWPTDTRSCDTIRPGRFTFALPSRLVREVGKCKPFLAYAEWEE